ncbi:MAG: sugar transferase [Aphanizomenon flos-aquae KM1D3_PB]|jgi:lipopolysaccharide/colanic/teichoic acid biosynthesis glycosyltransferase|uniref:sugar transferase n=1 Tax=Aphanizomenon flos-aquae TaxID=1176 RepID=UPI000541B937|nr:sugar transferase [Aphanizomenon flos-aquae]KHG42106.1 UDP-galactose phosphate transferase [Aphanizomenon flos-aquae 2012/KM1/D3]QSV69430.1 MAG: sugar transferase [Aphanizomenon flos-aquae KM1D3_PB]
MMTENFRRHHLISRLIKSGLDKLMAIIALIILSPLMLVIAIALYLHDGRPVIFNQPRPGKDARVFNFYKFRTMTNEKDEEGNLLPDEKRLTSFGKFLRKTSLDELPQLWNILKGDMSFVGPRPLRVEYLELYTPEQARRHEVLPGITGLAQVNGRNAISWETKFKLDVSYIDDWSLGLDFKILLLTVWKVLKRENINQEGYATAGDFKGQV